MAIRNSYYSKTEIANLGIKKCGRNVKISKKVSFYCAEKISIGNNVRIDDFCILSGDISIGSYVHIAAYCGLFARHGIVMKDFSALSSRVSIYSVSDDYFGNSLTNPTVPDRYRELDAGKVVLEKHVIVGSGTIILPNTKIKTGSAIGALSLVKGDIPPWGIYNGNPVRFRAKRKSSEIIKLEKRLLAREADKGIYDR
ncbi:MAG: acyltransferase [Deltaproteobacteria bacterium]|nr:acyltransferase [Deltaproteobacteria bacterium]